MPLTTPSQPLSPAAVPTVLPYAQLKHCHREFDRQQLETIEDLYEAGWRLLDKARSYLPQSNFEIDTAYDYRCRIATCLPYFGQIVDQFVSDLFSQPLNVTAAGDADNPNTPGDPPDVDYYTDFAKNADGGGTPFADILNGVVRTALKVRRAYLFVDAPELPADAPAPANKAAEEAAGTTRCYVYELPPAQLIDWKLDKRGEYEWLVTRTLDEEQLEPATARVTVREVFTVWRRGATDADGASWARYVAEYDPAKAPQDTDLVRLEAADTTSFRRIPVLRLELPKGFWIGNKVGTQQLEHWRRRSELIGSESRSCHAIPTTFLAGEMSAAGQPLPSEVQQDPNRGRNALAEFRRRGTVRLGAQDDFRFVEPTGAAYELIDKQLDGLKDEMFRVVHMMAASVKNTPGSLGRSGLSKMKDGEATARVLAALGSLVRSLCLRVYDTISVARGEDVVWVAHGLDSYETDDRQEVLDESLQLQGVNIPSDTFKKEHAKRVAAKLVPNLPPATVAVINDEIDGGVDQNSANEQLMKDAAVDQALNPPAPVVVAGAPGVPPGKGGPPPGAKAKQVPGGKPPAAKGK